MTDVFVHPDPSKLRRATAGRIPVHLYGRRPTEQGVGVIGGPVLKEVARVQPQVDPTAFDFLSLSLAVTAADTFVDRDLAADGWARRINLTVALAQPRPWQRVSGQLEQALNFLSGDIWSLHITGDGDAPPPSKPRARIKLSIEGCDCVCLYSGGLDSAIGALNLCAENKHPVLVSHAYPRDAGRQEELLRHLGGAIERFALNANPKAWLDRAHDVQMRTRSLNFLAMGALMASTLAGRHQREVTLYVPENGLIAVNPPLTPRRIGALSTRTTHPHYLRLIQHIFEHVGMPVILKNPYAHVTKGEMIRQCQRQAELQALAARSVSCGKWKRSGEQCGRCVPCLIRRASFHAAGWADRTAYTRKGRDLNYVYQHGSERDDLMAMILASKRLPGADVANWVALTGPMPSDPAERGAITGAVSRGLAEVRDYLGSLNLLG
jgi:hypothetical protein